MREAINAVFRMQASLLDWMESTVLTIGQVICLSCCARPNDHTVKQSILSLKDIKHIRFMYITYSKCLMRLDGQQTNHQINLKF